MLIKEYYHNSCLQHIWNIFHIVRILDWRVSPCSGEHKMLELKQSIYEKQSSIYVSVCCQFFFYGSTFY